MNFNKLLLLHPTLLESAASSTIGRQLPISPTKQRVPITAVKSWQHKENFLYKEYEFSSVEKRNRFITNVISYEEVKNHNAKIVIDGLKVGIKVTTKNVNKVTELDKEYSRAVDSFEKDVNIND